MDRIDRQLDLLARRAKEQDCPSFSVADAVMAKISGRQAQASYFAFDVFAAVAAVAAAVLLVIGIHAYLEMTGPVVRLYPSVSGASLW